MANDINVVVLVGRLTRDSELKTTPGGSSVCRFTVAVNRRKKTGDTWVDEANFFDVTYWGKIAETLRPYLTKGKQVSIQGELRQDRWEQDGQTRSKIEIVASNVQLLSGSTTGGTGAASGFVQSGYGQQGYGQSGSFQPSQGYNGTSRNTRADFEKNIQNSSQGIPQSSSFRGGSSSDFNEGDDSSPEYNEGFGPETFEDADIPF